MKILSKLAIVAAMVTSAGSAYSVPVTLGALFSFTGTGASAGVDGSIYDKDIHSGVFRDVHAAPSGLGGAPLLSDSYVLQGGDPFGGDTQDTFETTQALGHATINSFDIFTHYAFGNPPCSAQAGTCIVAGPDTGWVELVNNSLSTWTGVLSLTGQAFGGSYGPAQFFANSGAVTLAVGDRINILLNNESSNYGGYNHPDAIPEPASIALVGIALLGLAGAGTRRRQSAR